jgi:cytochrome c-type biogenesis protein CcmH
MKTRTDSLHGARLIALAIALLLASTLFAQNVAIPDAEQLVGAPKGAALSGVTLDAQTQEVASAIRCPVCQGLSIADSPSEMAVNMKAQVRSLLARGYTREQIETYFERSYGQFVLLRPKFEGVNGMVWVLPILALVLGVAVVAMKLRKSEQPQTTSNQQPVTNEDDEYVSRVRDLVRGTK